MLQIAEVGIEASELVEVELGSVEIIHLVSDVAEKVMRIADLPRLDRELETLLAVLASFLVVAEIGVAVAELDDGVGTSARILNPIEHALHECDAFDRRSRHDLAVAEVRDEGYAAERLRSAVGHRVNDRERFMEAVDRRLELRIE